MRVKVTLSYRGVPIELELDAEDVEEAARLVGEAVEGVKSAVDRLAEARKPQAGEEAP